MKEGWAIYLANAPINYFELLGYLPENVELLEETPVEPIDFVHWFVRDMAELKSDIMTYQAMIKKTGMLWISWPKGSSPLQSDFNGNDVRSVGLSSGLVDNKVCAVDEDWSGCRFVYRLKER
ncbi:MAG: DUF3052 family protein [Bacteroidota bacterium]